MALRSRIVLECAKNKTNMEVAETLQLSLPTVGKWRGRFSKERLAGLADAPCPGQPRKITNAKVEEVIPQTLESKPANAPRWSTRGMARHCGLTQNAIHRIWRTFGFKPHLQDNFRGRFLGRDALAL